MLSNISQLSPRSLLENAAFHRLEFQIPGNGCEKGFPSRRIRSLPQGFSKK